MKHLSLRLICPVEVVVEEAVVTEVGWSVDTAGAEEVGLTRMATVTIATTTLAVEMVAGPCGTDMVVHWDVGEVCFWV